MKKTWLTLEFLVLCLVIPGVIIGFRLAPYMFPFLWAAALYALIILYFTKDKSWREIWGWKEVTRKNLGPILIRWALACVGMVVFIYLYNPDRAFALVRERADFLPYLLIMYPVMSALPQEFVFCTFFFKRFRPLFGDGIKMVLTSAVVFAYAHILYINPVAPVLSLLGGLIFARTYQKTGSLALVTLEHALYGNALFVIGLGVYFYSGNVPTGP